jgi:hypothetical protein
MSLGLILIKLLITDQDSHDSQFILSKQECIARLLNVFELHSSRWFFESFIDFYWIPLFMLAVSLLFYWRKKKYLYFIFLLSFVIGFWLISAIIYADDGGGIARERTFLPLFFFCGLPFVTEILPLFSSKWNKIFLTTLTVFIGIGFIKIAVAAVPYTKRLENIEKICVLANKEGKKKLLITKETADQISLGYSWGLGLESIMYSSMKGVDSTVNMFIIDTIDSNIPEYKNPDIYLAVPWWTYWDINNLNPHYFNLPKQPCSKLVIEDGKMVIKDL